MMPSRTKYPIFPKLYKTSTKFSFLILAISLALIASTVSAQTTVSQYFQGFEADGIWDAPFGVNVVNRVASGTNGVTSKTGGFHGQVGTQFTRWGGYSGTFPAHGYTTTVAVYLNMSGVNDTRFDFTSAISTPANAHRRDFAFNAGYYNDSDVTGSGPRFVFSASNSTGRANSFPKNPARDPFAVTSSGWYTLKHRFFNGGAGALFVELSILNSAGATLHTWATSVVSNPTDIIGSTVGGNRYGWFASNEFGGTLAIDDSERAVFIETLWVDQSDGQAGPGGCADATPAFTTITAAVAAAGSGDTIKVCPGTYNESPAISKSLILQSTGGRDVTTIQLNASANAYPYGGMYLSGTGSDITIDGFTIRGVDGTPTVSATTNILIANQMAGVVIKNNRILVGFRDFIVDNEDSVGIASNYTVTPANYTASVMIDNNEIGPVTAGAMRRPFYINPGVTDLTVQNNQINGDFQARAVSEADTTLIDNNVVTGTGTSYGFGLNNGGSPTYVGSTVTRNIVSNTVWGLSIGTYLSATNATVTGNAFTGGTVGILIQAGATGINANFNRIVGNAIGIDNSAASINAENNWWGCNYGPGATGAGCVGGPTNSIVGAADANPWLRLTTSAATPSVVVGGTDLVTSLLTTNSDGNTPGGGFVPNGTLASFAGTFGTVAPPVNTTTSGSTGTTFTGTAQGVGGVATTVDGQTVSAQITVYNATCVAVSIPSNIPTLRNQPVTVPINVDLVTGRNILGYVTTINYDATKLTYTGFDKSGTLSSAFDFTVDNSVPGTIQMFAFGPVPLSGSGVLVNLSFTATGAISAIPTPVSLPSFSFNEGDPCSTTTDGSVTIISGNISGRVLYNLNPVTGIPLATMSATGSVNVSTVTDNSGPATFGNYTLSGLGSGPYLVTPSKPAQPMTTVNGIAPADSACIAQWGVGQTCSTVTGGPTTAAPAFGTPRFRAGDVTKNGTLSPLDAAYIAQFSVGTPNPGFAGTWEFIPASTNYTAAEVETGMSNQDYTAILLGDVTGNYSPTGQNPFAARRNERVGKNTITATVGDVKASAGSPISVPVSIQDLTGRGVTSYQFDLYYDPRVVVPTETAASLASTTSEGMNVVFNRTEAGRLRVAVYGISPLAGSGTLINLHFKAVGEAGGRSVLALDSLVLNEGGIPVVTLDGQLTFVKGGRTVSPAKLPATIDQRIKGEK